MLTLVKKQYHIEAYKKGSKRLVGDCHTNSISNLLNLMIHEYGYKIIKAVEMKKGD